MEIFRAAAGVASTGLAIACTLPYWLSIINGRSKPHQFSWIVFTIMNGIVTVAQFLAGGRSSVLISLTFFIASFVNLLLSFKYGTRNTSRFDKALFVFSLLTIGAWLLSRDNDVAIWLTVLIDVFATAMILLKVRADPFSEAFEPWLLGMLAYVFSCMTLAGTAVGILYVRPVYGLLTDMIIVLMIVVGMRRARA